MKKIVLVVSLILILLLAGCNKNNQVDNSIDNDVPEIVPNNQQEEIFEEDNNTNEIIVNDLSNLISEVEIKGKFVPNVNLDSDDINMINDKIIELVDEYHDISYKYNIDNDVLYVFIDQTNYFDQLHGYYAYIIDVNGKKSLKNSEVINQENIDKIMNKIPELYDEFFEKYKKDNEEIVKVDWDSENNRHRQLMPQNIDDLIYYMDEAKGPQIVLKMISLAGPDFINYVYDLNDYL